jgi:collagenase-like PrtC family protease
MKICLATNWDDKLLEGIDGLNRRYKDGKVQEVFGSYRANIVGSGRPSLILPEVTSTQARDHIELAHSMGLRFNYLINASCMGNREFSPKHHRELLEYLDEIVNLGADSVTVSLSFLMEVIRDQYPDMEIVASSICRIDSVRKAVFFEKLGADRIILAKETRRNFGMLERIRRAVNCQLELLGNTACIFQCPYEISHGNINAHGSQISNQGYGGHYTEYPMFRCNLHRLAEPAEFLRSGWIRPEDVGRYQKLGMDYIKIEGRQQPTEWLLNCAEAYMARRYDGNVFDLLGESVLGYFQHSPLNEEPLDPLEIVIDNRGLEGFLDFFEEGNCKDDCTTCGYCQEWTEKTVHFDRELAGKYIESAKKLLSHMTTGRFLEDFEVKDKRWRESASRDIT